MLNVLIVDCDLVLDALADGYDKEAMDTMQRAIHKHMRETPSVDKVHLRSGHQWFVAAQR
jgi:hypothetical protein